MPPRRLFLGALVALAAGFVLAPTAAPAADQYLGTYVAQLSQNDHYASDGYPLSTAAQIVRQDRANFHRFGELDRNDEPDPWFGTNEARARLQSMLERPGAMSPATRRAIERGTPLVVVHVFRRHVEVELH